MENKDLGDKKMNGKQEPKKDFSGENIADDSGSEVSRLKIEMETDAGGNKKIVERARNTTSAIPEEEIKHWDENDNLNRGVSSEEDVKKTIENIDKNSDITPNRYPNSHPENHKNTGTK